MSFLPNVFGSRNNNERAASIDGEFMTELDFNEMTESKFTASEKKPDGGSSSWFSSLFSRSVTPPPSPLPVLELDDFAAEEASAGSDDEDSIGSPAIFTETRPTQRQYSVFETPDLYYDSEEESAEFTHVSEEGSKEESAHGSEDPDFETMVLEETQHPIQSSLLPPPVLSLSSSSSRSKKRSNQPQLTPATSTSPQQLTPDQQRALDLYDLDFELAHASASPDTSTFTKVSSASVLIDQIKSKLLNLTPAQFKLCVQQASPEDRVVLRACLSRLKYADTAPLTLQQRAENLRVYYLLKQASVLESERSSFSTTASTHSTASRVLGWKTEVDYLIDDFKSTQLALRKPSSAPVLILEEDCGIDQQEYNDIHESVNDSNQRADQLIDNFKTLKILVQEGVNNFNKPGKEFKYNGAISSSIRFLIGIKESVPFQHRKFVNVLFTQLKSLASGGYSVGLKKINESVNTFIAQLEEASKSVDLPNAMKRLEHWKVANDSIPERLRLIEEGKSTQDAKRAEEEAKRNERTQREQEASTTRSRIQNTITDSKAAIARWNQFKKDVRGFMEQITELSATNNLMFQDCALALFYQIQRENSSASSHAQTRSQPTGLSSSSVPTTELFDLSTPEVDASDDQIPALIGPDLSAIEIAVVRKLVSFDDNVTEAKNYIETELLDQTKNTSFVAYLKHADAEIARCKQSITTANQELTSSTPSFFDSLFGFSSTPSSSSQETSSSSSSVAQLASFEDDVVQEDVSSFMTTRNKELEEARIVKIQGPTKDLADQLRRAEISYATSKSLRKKADKLETMIAEGMDALDEKTKNLIYLEAASVMYTTLAKEQREAYRGKGKTREQKNLDRIEMGRKLFNTISPKKMYAKAESLMSLAQREKILREAANDEIRDRLAKD